MARTPFGFAETLGRREPEVPCEQREIDTERGSARDGGAGRGRCEPLDRAGAVIEGIDAKEVLDRRVESASQSQR